MINFPTEKLVTGKKNEPLINCLLQLADSNLILAQRNSEWCGHGPVLEQDIAITNITLDLIGQARNFYQYAAELIDYENVTEDTLAYLRTERDFKNLLICEIPNGDWGQTILRQFFYSTYQGLLYERLYQLDDSHLSAIAEKSIKEVAYHIKWSSEWVIRLGDGTDESHEKMLNAIDYVWQYTGEFFIPSPNETSFGIDPESMKSAWKQKISEILNEATIPVPGDSFMQTGGKSGVHTEHLGFILSELQYLQRAYPGAQW